MAMLAEPRRRQKWTLNPRGKHWSEDSNKFGQKMLEKMGWSSGKGLGANLDGMTDHIRLRYKNDQAGIGFSHDDRDKQWTQHQEGFNELLQKLHNGDTPETSTKDELSGKSLELKSKHSRARVHYQKFTRGKDVNKYSTKDLANIFGKKDLDEKLDIPETLVETKVEIDETPADPVGSSDKSHGVVTIKGGSITDYFKNKMPSLGKKSTSTVKNESESESETRAGFGFASVKVEVADSTSDKSTPRKHFKRDNLTLDSRSPKIENKSANFGLTFAKSEVATIEKSTTRRNIEHENSTCPKNERSSSVGGMTFVRAEVESPEEASETPRKRKIDYVFDNPVLDLASPKIEKIETPRKRKSDFVFENPCLELDSNEIEVNRTPKRRKSEFAFDNGGLDLETASKTVKTSVPSVSSLPVTDKKKRKKKSKESSHASEGGFTNEALNLEFARSDEIASMSQFEVSRSLVGVANDALDLADETNGKKRVTFNETVEYQTDSAKASKKRNKNPVKLDKFEVDNEKLKKKSKKSKRREAESVFVNEAMDVDILDQEASDNASNERKSERARRKRERRTVNLETIAEAPEDDRDNAPEVVTLDDSLVGDASENFEIMTLDTPKKKKKKKKKKKSKPEVDETKEENRDDLDITIDISEEMDEISSKIERKLKKSKKREPEVVTIEETLRDDEKKKKNRKTAVTLYDPDEEMEVVNLEEVIVVRKEKTKKNSSATESTSMDKENVEVSIAEDVEGSKKSKKRRKSKNSMDTEEAGEKIVEKIADDTTDVQNGTQSPWDDKVKKSKRIFKALFARSPVLHFAGSNINEIKGYGVDV